MSTLTLQELRKAKFKTIKAFAAACGFSASKASMILQGRHHHVLSVEDIQGYADLLGVSFDACVEAAEASYDEWMMKEYHRHASKYWHLRTRWQREDELYDEVKNWKAKGGRDRIFVAIESIDAFLPFNLPATATKEDVMRAFREKVKVMADGQGGYRGDMDALVQAKEKALRFCKG